MKLTNPLLLPLRKIIPGFWGLDIAALVLLCIVQVIEVVLLALIASYPIQAWIVVIAAIKLIQLIINIYFFAVIIRAIISWTNPQNPHPGTVIVTQFTEPLLRPCRKIIPLISGIDFSPLALLILLQVISIFLQVLVGGQ
jgi:YggT family protein